MGLIPGEEFCDGGEQVRKCAKISWLMGPPRILFSEYVDRSCQGEDVEKVDVVVTPCGPSMSQVQELKSETSGVWRESGVGDEIC